MKTFYFACIEVNDRTTNGPVKQPRRNVSFSVLFYEAVESLRNHLYVNKLLGKLRSGRNVNERDDVNCLRRLINQLSVVFFTV